MCVCGGVGWAKIADKESEESERACDHISVPNNPQGRLVVCECHCPSNARIEELRSVFVACSYLSFNSLPINRRLENACHHLFFVPSALKSTFISRTPSSSLACLK